MKPIVLITGEAHPILATALAQMGYAVIDAPAITRSELVEQVSAVTGLILTSRHHIDADLLARADKLEWIGRLGSGLDVVDLNAAEKKGIKVISSPEGNRQAVAEHTLGLLLNLIRHQTRADREVRQRRWNRNENRGYELSGLTLGIIGYGNTGEAVSRALTSLGMRVLAYDKYRTGFGGEWATETDLDTIRKEADVVSLHLPLTTETLGWVDDAWLESFTKPIWLINTSRGTITPLEPLIRQLERGRLRGLALDVLPNESLTHYSEQEQQRLDQLLAFDSVVLTPHIAGYTQESPERMARILLEKLGADPSV